MAVYEGSRYRFTEGRVDDDARSYLTEREPYGFRALPDNRHHVVEQGDTLYTIAGRYFQPLPRPAGFWWVVADFQPQPIHDPTIQLVPGAIVVVPSVRTLVEDVLGEGRRLE